MMSVFIGVLHPHLSSYLPVRPEDPGEVPKALRMEKPQMERGRVPECGAESPTPAPGTLIQVWLEEE